MEEYPFVTVITPTHNIIDAGFADDFNILTTLLNRQTYPSVEHLVIDKTSTDGTVELLSDYKSKGYLQFFSESDSGKFDALNKGIMRAKGKYVTFLNCEDFIHDITALAEIIDKMEELDADYSFAPSYSIHPDGFVLTFEPAILNVFQVMPCPRQAMLYKKSILAKENFFDLKFKYAADFDLIMRLVIKKYSGIYYPKNYVTSKMSPISFDNPDLINNECRQIYIKNLRAIYPLTNEIVDKMLKYSDFPQDLLEKLSEFFAPEYKEHFMKACEEMKQVRTITMTSVENQATE